LLVVCGRRFDAVSGAGVWVSKTVMVREGKRARESEHTSLYTGIKVELTRKGRDITRDQALQGSG
jgi:hypothetical protein